MRKLILVVGLFVLQTYGWADTENWNVWQANIWICESTPDSCRRKTISYHFRDFFGCGKAVTKYIDKNYDSPTMRVWGECSVLVNDMIDSKLIPDYKNRKWCRYCE